MNHQTEISLFLALAQIPLINSTFGHFLLDNFTSSAELLTASTTQLATIGFSSDLIEKIANPNWKIIENNLNWAQIANHHLITIFDPRYPQLLREIKTPPLLLFVDGDPDLLSSPQIALVGSRNPSPLGKENALAFAQELALSGFTITSGLALGIDTASHLGALEANKSTIAVVGTGLDQTYPKSNVKLAQRIGQQGAIVSEYPLATLPNALHFPQRNRIISGLSLGTLVVEASQRSGSLITAHYAAEQGREVFAIPGAINHSLARGCHSLIREGAKLVEKTGDLLEELKPLITLFAPKNIAENKLHSNSQVKPNASSDNLTAKSLDPNRSTLNFTKIAPPNNHTNQNKNGEKIYKHLDKKHHLLLQCIDFSPTPVDELVERSKFSLKEILNIILDLELSGLIIYGSGGYQRLK